MMSTVADTLAAILTDPLAHARQAKQPLAYVGNDMPPDLGLATGRVFCHLPAYPDRPTPRADEWLESSFPGWTRSILEDWADGRFDFFEAVIFSRGDDATQRLYYYVCELQRRGYIGGPRTLVLDVATIPRRTSIRHCERALQILLKELEVTADQLAQGVEEANLRRLWYQSLVATRTASGRLIENLARAIMYQDVYDLLGNVPFPQAEAGNTVLLAGSAPADDSIHRAVEDLNWNVCAELHQRALSRFGPPIEVHDNNAVAALAQRVNAQLHGARSFGDRAQLLEQEIVASAPRAVVLWLTEEDEGMAWDIARQRKILEKIQVPHLVLTRRRWDGKDGAADEVAGFLRELQS